MTLFSPLHEEHVKLGAKLVDFGGWQMPLQYTGVIAEHTAVRSAAGLFDVSHLGKLVLDGGDSAEALELVLPGKVASLAPWSAGYNLVLDDRGGIVDDIFVYRRPDSVVLVPNAANVSNVLSHLVAALPEEVGIIDARERWAILALQGPSSRAAMNELLPKANDMRLHTFADADIEGIDCQVARTGYTGEYGFEFFVAWGDAPKLWKLLLRRGSRHGVVPAGLGARDTLRLEMGYPLHGNDISVETNPLEASLGWVIDWEKPRFVGRESLLEIKADGTPRRLIGLIAKGREIPRAHYPVEADGRTVGEVTSGNFSPVLRTGIGLAYVETEWTRPGSMLSVLVRTKQLPVEVTKPPFVRG